MKIYDVIIIGAGAAGLTAARVAQERGKHVLILDMGDKPARKVAASGGGKCNITNLDVGIKRYFGENPNFVRGALSRVTPYDILDWCSQKNVSVYEKTPGRFFCVDGADAVVAALISDLKKVEVKYNHLVTSVLKTENHFVVEANACKFFSRSVIVATGGTSFGTLGVSDFGHRIAKQFGHKIVPLRPGLCAIATRCFDSDLSGISLPVEILVGREKISDDMLFTHFGIGGPAIYRATVRDMSNGIQINMCPTVDLFQELKCAKQENGRRSLTTVLSQYIPMRLARFFVEDTETNIADLRDTTLDEIARKMQSYHLKYSDIKLHNLQSAEIVCGGISTEQISSKTMESRICPGLFFAGEVIDVAGDLGGFNLHWAWASGHVAGMNI